MTTEQNIFNTVSEMSYDEIINISFHLQKYHGIFNKFFNVGKPIFDMSLPTAAVYVERASGNFLYMKINPIFWRQLNLPQKLFVIIHECSHLILGHPMRSIAFDDPEIANIAADLVVNHMAVEKFGCIRTEIDPTNNYYWIDKCFKPEENIPTNETLEYYYPLLKSKKDAGELPTGSSLVDGHETMTQEDYEKIMKEFDKLLTPQEKDALKNTMNVHGTGEGKGLWTFFNIKVKKKKKWETIIKKWSLHAVGRKEKIVDQWARINRRFVFLKNDLFLPSEMEYDDVKKEKTKIKIHFYLDTSGSCHHLSERFFKAAKSLPEDKFEVRLFCFHDFVVETDIAGNKVHKGVGTNFQIIEDDIQNIIKKENSDYPASVWVVSDGMASKYTCEKPERWHWFLSENNIESIDKKSKIYMLKDFE